MIREARSSTRRWVYGARNGAILLSFCASLMAAPQPLVASPPPEDEVFAWVNGEPVLNTTYRAAIRAGGRQRFYHGRPPEAEVIAFRKEVGEQLVHERLMLQEAARRGIEPDTEWVEQELERLVAQYSRKPGWAEEEKKLLPMLRAGLEERSRIDRMAELSREVEAPTEEELRAFYQSNPEAFTSPEQTRVSMIMLKVEPWADSARWDERKREAVEIYGRLRDGADYAELARSVSDDDSSANGGDMGYLHRGMLGSEAQKVIDDLSPGELSEPAVLLEGVAIFRLEERLAATLNPLDKVRERATALWIREARDQAQQAFVGGLAEQAEIRFVNPSYFLVVGR